MSWNIKPLESQGGEWLTTGVVIVGFLTLGLAVDWLYENYLCYTDWCHHVGKVL